MNPAYKISGAFTDGSFMYNYVNSRAGACSCVGHRNAAPRCHPECFGAQRRNVSKDRQRASTNTRRGYTGHEHLDKYNLINMTVPNKRAQSQACLSYAEREVQRGEASTDGRVYDPIIGRFLSPDPVLQDPANAQNYNKFSYVLNNPLKFTDPSGYRGQQVYRNLQAPDMLAENKKLNLAREAAWQATKGQGGGNGVYAFLSVLCGGSGGGGGGNMFGPNPTASAPEGEDAGSGENADGGPGGGLEGVNVNDGISSDEYFRIILAMKTMKVSAITVSAGLNVQVLWLGGSFMGGTGLILEGNNAGDGFLYYSITETGPDNVAFDVSAEVTLTLWYWFGDSDFLDETDFSGTSYSQSAGAICAGAGIVWSPSTKEGFLFGRTYSLSYGTIVSINFQTWQTYVY